MVGHHLPDPPVPPHYRSPGKPHPGLIAALARTLIESVVSQYDLAEAISIAPEQSRKATDLFRKRIQDWAGVISAAITIQKLLEGVLARCDK